MTKGIRHLRDSNEHSRRVRDLIRSQVHHGDYLGGQLPSETELMVSFGASRSVVRDALSWLRNEGVIDRLQGVGTFVVSVPAQSRLTEAHGMSPRFSLPKLQPSVLDIEVVPTPAPVVARLGVHSSPTCARIEYVALAGDQPVGLATNYVIFPEADALLRATFRTDWYNYLSDAGLPIGDTEFVIGAVTADASSARLLGVAEGAPLLYMEQVIEDTVARRYNFAIIYCRSDSFMLLSRASWQRQPGEVTGQ